MINICQQLNLKIEGPELERFKVEFNKIYPYHECHSKRRQWMRKELYFTSLAYMQNPNLVNKEKHRIISTMYARNYYFAKDLKDFRRVMENRLNAFVRDANEYKANKQESKLPDLRIRYKIVKDLLMESMSWEAWDPDFNEITKQQWEAFKNY